MTAAYLAVKHRGDAVRLRSSSGGVFPALCKYMIGQGGVVYGARFDEDMRVVHGRADSIEKCARFSGSKYVQSDMGTCYQSVRDDLRSGIAVLFSGTPCQVAGLRSFVAASRTQGKLLTVDLICHGVPSPVLWAEHIALMEIDGSRVVDYRFRDKSTGWRRSGQTAILDGGAAVRDLRVDAFREISYSSYALRPSCYECPYASMERVSDITIGDYWGVEKDFPEFDDNRGVSLVLLNSPAGANAFSTLSSDVECLELEQEQFKQQNLLRPTPLSRRREAFWRMYQRAGYESTIRRYTSYGLIRRAARKLRRSVRR